ncbi:oligosaccharyl transferase, STT3 subunit [Thermococcus sp.]
MVTMKRKFERAVELAEKFLEPRYALPFIIITAAVFRLIPLRYHYLFGYDPYFHLAYIEESLKVGKWIRFLTIAGGANGAKISHPLGLYLTPYYVYKFLSLFGVSLYDAFRVTPVIFGVLTIIFFYLSMLNLYGKREAFFSAFFLSVMFGHIFRSSANYYRGDNYMLFWYSVALFGISLALTKTRRVWRYRRFAFYLIPAFASGFAAIFWQAYYPIFVFLIGNAVLLAFGAFILGKDKYLPDSAALTISTALGVLLANSLGSRFGYGMLGGNRWLARKTAEKLGVKLGAVKDVYLLVHLKYLVPLALAGAAALFLLSKVVKDKKQRVLIAAALSIAGVLSLLMRFKALRELSSGFGIFRNAPILETQHSSFGDLWMAYSIAIFLCLLFVLRFTPKRVRLSDFLILGFIAPGFYMLYTWTRFLFIGSMAVAAAAGLGLVSLHDAVYPVLNSKSGRRKVLVFSLSLLVVLPALTAAFGFKEIYAEKPVINDHWVQALTLLGNNSNENDIVLTWWDHGHWVTYYARRSPVAQGGPSRWVALYYLGKASKNQLMARGVDYVIVSYDTVLKFGAVLDTANVSKEGYALMVLPLVSRFGTLLFERNGYMIIAQPGERWKVVVNINGNSFSPREAFLEYKGSLTALPLQREKIGNAYVYMNLNYGYAVLMSEKTFNTTLARLMFTNEYPSYYRLVYSDGGYIKIFRFIHPNIAVERENGRVILKFENATGTGLGIFGYLDNGTLVFKKWYPVKGKSEFILPEDMNGSVVVKYTYVRKRTVLDRGIFRIYPSSTR